MTKIFIGGSRRISKFNEAIRERLSNIIAKSYWVLVGDANGVDKAVQKYLSDKKYTNVVIYCSGSLCRNNVGNWRTINVEVDPQVRGRSFYMEKDLKMSEDGDYGFMLWDGKSAGTINNILNLLQRNKVSLVYFSPQKKQFSIKDINSLEQLLKQCDDSVIQKIDKKISLKNKLSEIKKPRHEQMALKI